ncbi:radical SAM domain-containing protein, partial [Candidatus Magnetomorum sp. HK-1]
DIPYDGDFYGVSCTTPDYHHAVEIAKLLKKNSSGLLILGGIHASVKANDVLSHSFFDICVIGEGEITMADIVNGKPFSEIPGIAYKKNGSISFNPRRPFIKNLDILHPTIMDIEYKKYIQPIIMNDPNSNGIAMMTSRGCPYQCIFCASSFMWQRKIRYHSIEYIIEKLKYYKSLGINYFFFCDDTFFININRAKMLMKAIKKLDITWRCSATTNKITPQIASIMADSGCKQVDFGIESGSDRMLSIMKKISTVEDHINAIKNARKEGIVTKCMLMVGLPNETEDDVKQTISFVKKNDSDMYALTVFVPLPGCDIAEKPEFYNFSVNSNVNYEDYYIVGASKQTPIIHKEQEKIEVWRDLIWEAIGKKATLNIIQNRN